MENIKMMLAQGATIGHIAMEAQGAIAEALGLSPSEAKDFDYEGFVADLA